MTNKKNDIAVCSMFRDSQSWGGVQINQVNRFFEQMEDQGDFCGKRLSYFLVEGNSQDNTWEVLNYYCDVFTRRMQTVKLFKQEVQGSSVASIVSEARFKNLSAIGNTVLRAARDSDCDDVFWVESDFYLPRYVLNKLLYAKEQEWWDTCLGVCPIPFFKHHFYDTWAFEGINGERWGNNDLDAVAGQMPDGSKPLGRYRQMRSFGSCALLNGDNLRRHGLDFRDGCFPALCAAGREAGLSLWCDTGCGIEHPSARNINGRLV